jgi:hypothetical protein
MRAIRQVDLKWAFRELDSAELDGRYYFSLTPQCRSKSLNSRIVWYSEAIGASVQV